MSDPESKNRKSELARKSVYRAWELGVVIYYVGTNVLEITPPLTIKDHEIEMGIGLIAQAIADAKAGLVTDEMIAAFAGW